MSMGSIDTVEEMVPYFFFACRNAYMTNEFITVNSIISI